MTRGRERSDLMARFWSKVQMTEKCWIWQSTTKNGYGVLYVWEGMAMRGVRAHRFIYEKFVGPIPTGLTIDHLCRNRICVNPQHLEAVTLRENILRSDSAAAINARKTHCVNGHELSGSNLRFNRSRTRRICVTCKNLESVRSRRTCKERRHEY